MRREAIPGPVETRVIPPISAARPVGRPGLGSLRALEKTRVRRLLGLTLEYIGHPSFEDPACAVTILGPTPGIAGQTARLRGAELDSQASEVARLGAEPPLSGEQEYHLFRKMNFLKYQAVTIRERIDPARARSDDLDRLEQLLGEAKRIKDQIIRANMRLVLSIARRRTGPSGDLFETVSDGAVALIRAVDRFDFGRGYKFSTYATFAIRNTLLRSAETVRDRLVADPDLLLNAVDTRVDEREQEKAHAQRLETIAAMLKQLDDRERKILVGRYGLDGTPELTLRQLGLELGITKERVRQIESRARAKLRKLAVGELEIPGWTELGTDEGEAFVPT